MHLMGARQAGSSRVVLWVAFLAALFGCGASLPAQTSGTGALTGTVTDTSGAVIPGAVVTATNIGTGQSRTATTDATGNYNLSLLPAGLYRVTFSAQGFKTVEVRSVDVNVTEVPVLNESLSVGSKSERVTVSAGAETLQTQNAAIGKLTGSKEATDIPLSSRNYTQLVATAPGVNANVPNAAAIGNGTQDVNVNGSGSDQNNYMMDGASITNYASGGAAQSGYFPGIGIPNPDAIQEFKVQTAQYDASYGRNPGASINVVTKGGTNEFHGAAWEFFRNNALDANDFFFKQQQLAAGQANEPQTLRQNQFGGTIGGPVKKDKLFFFGSYQGTRQVNAVGSNGLVTGFSSGISMPPFNNPCGNRSDGCDGQTYRQYLGSVFAGETDCFFGFVGTCVPVAADGSNINQVAINILRAPGPKGGFNDGYYVPSGSYVPSRPGSCAAPCLTSVEGPAIANEDQFLVNTDYVISAKQTLTEKYFFSRDPQVQPFDCIGGGCMPGAPEDATYTDGNALLKLTSSLTNHLVNEARFSYQRETTNSKDDISIKACDVGIIPMINNGAPCPAAPNAVPEFYLLPAIVVGSNNGFGSIDPWGVFQQGAYLDGANQNYFNVFQYADQISWSPGRQSLRAGFEAERTQWNVSLPNGGRGLMFFGNVADFLTSASGTPGTNCGLPGTQPCPAFAGNGIFYNQTTRLAPDNPNHHEFRANAFSAFVQDDVKVTPRFVLNFGLRWEFDGNLSDRTGHYTNVWTSKATLANNGSFFLNNPAGTLAGFVVPSNYNPNSPVCDGPCGYTAADGAGGVFVNSNKTLVHGTPLTNFAPRIGLAWQPIGEHFVVRAGYGIFYDRVYGNLLGINQAFMPPFAGSIGASFTQTLDNPFGAGAPGWTPRTMSTLDIDPTYGPIVVGGSDLSSGRVAESIGTPMVQEYNLDLQYEFGGNWFAEIGYVGTHGTHLYDYGRSINISHLVPGAPNEPTDPQNSALIAGSGHVGTPAVLPFNDANNPEPIGANLVSNAVGRVTYLGFDPAGLLSTSTEGDHRYNSFQAQFRHSTSHGLLFQVSYTWSKLITNINGPESGGGLEQAGNILSGGATSNNVLDFGQQYGPAAFNRSQRLIVSYTYDLPSKRKTGLGGALLSGWNISGVTILQNGEPFTIVDGSGGTIYWGSSPFSLFWSARANLADPVRCNSLGVCHSGIPLATSGSVESRLNHYINPNAFSPEPCIGGTVQGDCPDSGGGTGFGDSAIGVITGPAQFNWDISIQKRTKISEAVTVVFRSEFYNAFNHPQFNPPINDANTSAQGVFGLITSTSVAPRIIQFGIKLIL
jgi:Carboxypeptidase regulatory-like domain/TonB-dependent Receptor Plug Domain